MTLRAELCFAGPAGERRILIDELWRADGIQNKHVEPGEILVRVILPPAPAGHRGAYGKLRDRDSIDFPLFGCAVRLDLGEDGKVTDADLCAVALVARPSRVRGVADLLIGTGCVATIECSGVSLGEFGFAPRFRAAVEGGAVRIKDATCQAIYAAVQASEKGAPFAPLRGLIGTDILRFRDDWKVIQNPMADGDDPVVVVPAIRPDIALFHARLGDRLGNVWVGNARECVLLAHAASAAIATFEEIHDGNLMEDERYLSGTIPPIYVSAIAHVPGGALPAYSAATGAVDGDHMAAYAAAAKTDDGFRDYLDRHVMGAMQAA